MLRRQGAAEAVSWAAALDNIAERLRSLTLQGKAVGVLGSPRATNEENYLAARLARACLQTNNVDFGYHALWRPLLAGVEDVTGRCWPSTRLADIQAANTMVLVEGDLATTHPRAASFIFQALQRGARLIVIGCARTRMARLASCFLETTPGSEHEALDDLRGGTCVSPAWLEAERVVFLLSPLSHDAGRLRRCAAAMALLAASTGHAERPGSGLILLPSRSNTRGACEMGVAPDRLPGYERLTSHGAQQRLERVWGKPVPTEPGLDAQQMLESVSGLIVLANDPAAVLPNEERTRVALKRLEFLVTLDAFETRVTEAAHAVLPIASHAETEGTFTSLEGRVQRVRMATDPPGEAVQGWEALAELCARLGGSAPWTCAADIRREIAQAAPGYCGAVSETPDGAWSSSFVKSAGRAPFVVRASAVDEPATPERPYVLSTDVSREWQGDPLFASSPSLNREPQAERRMFPNGVVEMSAADAEALSVRTGAQVRLKSAHGAAIVSIRRRDDLRRGVVLAPWAFRDSVAAVLCARGVANVSIERV